MSARNRAPEVHPAGPSLPPAALPQARQPECKDCRCAGGSVSPRSRRIAAWALLSQLFIAVALAASASASTVTEALNPRPPERPAVQKAVEPNGLRLLAAPNPSSDIVAIDALIRVGVRDEPENEAGIAALLGEVMIRGTQRHPAAEMPAAVAAAGGSLEVIPGFDFTELSLSTTRDRFSAALQLVAEVLGAPSLEPAALEAGRAALERRISEQNRDLTAASYQELLLQMYPTDPYGRPVLGYPDSLKQIDQKKLAAFYHEHYVQNNMVIAVAGNIDPEAAVQQARKAFDGIPFRSLAPRPALPAPTPARPRIAMRRQAAPAAQVMLGGLAPPTTAAIYPTWSVLDAMMGGGKRSRLFMNLREKSGIGYVLGSFYQPMLQGGHLVAYVVTDAYRTDPKSQVPKLALDVVRNRILEQFEALAEHGPTDAELRRAKNYAIGSFARQHERNRDQAHWLVWMEAMGMGYGFDRELPAKIAAVTKEQIQQASKECLNNYALVVTIPTSDPGSEAP